ncbi:hypothetical protein GHT06_020344 [Daphnia sinensis]|uniref:Uncharacterized protein n=1 Tax=Daphnia sinensis TaxID=1820382 RepID=A0AAD5PPE0_9CRUS|nr:hypothetical protein GHT06_020344 [Daphnia sinensis]
MACAEQGHVKSVFVVVEENDKLENDCFEVSFLNSSGTVHVRDIDCVMQQLRRKSKRVEQLFGASEICFKQQKTSPIKDSAMLRCVIKPKALNVDALEDDNSLSRSGIDENVDDTLVLPNRRPCTLAHNLVSLAQSTLNKQPRSCHRNISLNVLYSNFGSFNYFFFKETKSRVAMQLLPLLITPRKKEKHESASTQSSIDEIQRPAPFILAIGAELYVVTAGQVFFKFGSQSSTEAILALLAAYYIFDLEYSKYVKSTLFFLQSYCLKEPDRATDSCSALNVFLSLIECYKDRSSQ